MDRQMIGMVIAAVRVEGDEHLRRHVANDREDRRFDFEHVDVDEGPRIVEPEPLLARGITKAEEPRRGEAEDLTGAPEFLRTVRAEIGDRPDRWMRLPRFPVRRTRERDPHALRRKMRQHPAAMKQLVVGMRIDGKH
jgi:hypothetical protein